MAETNSDAVAAVEAAHQRVDADDVNARMFNPDNRLSYDVCSRCFVEWPCPVAQVLAERAQLKEQLAAATDEADHLAAQWENEQIAREAAEAKLAELQKPCGACSGSGCLDCSIGMVRAKLADVERALAEQNRINDMLVEITNAGCDAQEAAEAEVAAWRAVKERLLAASEEHPCTTPCEHVSCKMRIARREFARSLLATLPKERT